MVDDSLQFTIGRHVNPTWYANMYKLPVDPLTLDPSENC